LRIMIWMRFHSWRMKLSKANEICVYTATVCKTLNSIRVWFIPCPFPQHFLVKKGPLRMLDDEKNEVMIQAMD